MKTYIVVVCVAAALVGCAHNRGGMRNESGSQSGTSDSYDRSTQSTNNLNSSGNSSSTGNQNTPSPGSINSDNSK